MKAMPGYAACLALLATQLLGSCADLPPLMGGGNTTPNAPHTPHGPQVASLLTNMRCELYAAANSTEPLAFFRAGVIVPPDDPSLNPFHPYPGAPDPRAFTLQNIFQEIEYIGEATFTLDMQDTGGITPSLSLAKYYSGPIGELPATGALLSVGGQYTEVAHRNLVFNSSIDFARLSAIVPAPFPEIAAPPAISVPLIAHQAPCSDLASSELSGDLGLQEILATAMIAAAANGISALQIVAPNSAAATATGAAATVPANFAFGQFSTQVDFTITKGINGGPNWSLKYFKGPGNGSTGLFNLQRQIKDTLVVTFIPVCIRQKFWTNSIGPPYEYYPEMVVGTPGWANYLAPCGGPGSTADLVRASSAAISRNNEILLQSGIAQSSAP